jgi:hypothetical protein
MFVILSETKNLLDFDNGIFALLRMTSKRHNDRQDAG